MELYKLSVKEGRDKILNGEITSLQLTKAYLKRIKELNKKLNCYITIDEDYSLSMAEERDKLLKKGKKLLLHGVPIGIKDLINVESLPSTCASKILKDYISPFDATVIKKLKEEGAVILGKQNMDEFAMGSSNETSFFGPARNPWNIDYVPGGSSGGSASAVSAMLAPASLGSDTGGSIRQPASFCGCVGLKPTYGRVSRFGLIAFASSLDQIGPLTRNVEDSALLLKVISGQDSFDATTSDRKVDDFPSLLSKEVKGIRIGIPSEYFVEGITEDVERNIKSAISLLKELGCKIIDISLPHTKYAVAVYYIIAPSEASSNLARFDGVRYGFRAEDISNLKELYKKTRNIGFGREVKRRILIGTFSLSAGYYDAYYLKALKVRTLFQEDFKEAFKKCEVILTPTSPTPAFKIGERIKDPISMYLSDVFTIPVNLSGNPAISIPCGFSKDNLPVGMQLIGRFFDEKTILKVAYAFQENSSFHKKYPPL